MAKDSDSNKKKPGGRRGKNVTVTGSAAAFGAFADIVTSLVDRIGLTGAVFFALFYLVITGATPAQKEQIVDKYVLWKGVSGQYPFLIVAAVCAVVVLGQHYFYRRKLRVKDDEIERISKLKTEHQQRRINAPLHHSD